MSQIRHFVHSSRLTTFSASLCEQLELRLLLAADLPPSREFAAPSAFPDVPDVGTADNWNVNAVRAPAAWALGFTGQGVIVAVVDSGFDATDPELLGQIWTNSGEIAGNGRDDDANGFIDDTTGWDFVDGDNRPDDESGHGSLVAGVVAADDNGTGVIGIAPGAKIMPVRVLDNRDVGANASIAAGIRYAADNGANVINLSIGGAQNAGVLAAIQYALTRDVLVVAAAGNDAAETPSYPAAFSATLPNTISVGAYRATGTLGHFSNSVGDSGAVQVDAPGINILSSFTGQRTMFQSGTSMAAPHVAGIAALALSADPLLSVAQLRNLIVDGADRQLVGSDSRGVVNAARTVAAAASLRDPLPPEPARDSSAEASPTITDSPRNTHAIVARITIQATAIPAAAPSHDAAVSAWQSPPERAELPPPAWLVAAWQEYFQGDRDIAFWLNRDFGDLDEGPRLRRFARH